MIAGLGIGLSLLALAAIIWIGRLLRWGQPEDFPDLDGDGRANERTSL